MVPRFETLREKKLLGKSVRMSLANNKTPEVWKDFMLNRKAILNSVGIDLYSIQFYDDLSHFKNFNPQKEFTKWAATEVTDFNNIPNGFKSLTLPKGLYAVFLHKGLAVDFSKTMQYIFTQWLPQSDYELAHRPHFELLGEKYKNNDPSSTEEVWIPIRLKT